MAHYDFSQLSPHDFELMCRDLLQAEWGLVLESFKAGKDGGVDFRYARAGKSVVVQCKRFVQTGFDGLLREVRKEALKVRQLRPQRYVLMTAAPISDNNKAQIVELIGSDFLDPADIFGRDDLNNLLTRHPRVETSNYKLWLASTNVLAKVLHNDIVCQSEFQVEKIHSEIKRYVQGSAYPRAMGALKDGGVVILSGLPGVGKTTLANMLLYEHLASGFEPIVIRHDFAEGKAMFQKGKAQVFYFDDFMGVTFLGDKGSAHQQSEFRAIVEFIEMVAASKDKRLILTTREHLLHQAWGASEQLRNSDLIERKVIIQMGDYNYHQRAEILYNHIFFSDLPSTYQDELLRDEFYFKIVKHEKFNPRLIEWLSAYRRVKAVPIEKYQQFVLELLQNPSEIWRHAYHEQISDAGRSLLLTLFSLGGKVMDELLRPAFASIHQQRSNKYGIVRKPEDFGTARAELNGAFVRPSGLGSIEFINPSVLDWLNSMIQAEPENALDLVLGALRFSQVEQVWTFALSTVGGATLEMLRQNVSLVAGKIGQLAVAPRAITHPEGYTAYLAPTYEKRLETLIEMADTLRSQELVDQINAVIERIRDERETTHCDISDTVSVVRTFQRTTWSALKRFGTFFESCVPDMIESAAQSCRSDELREILVLFEPDDNSPHPLKSTMQEAYEKYVENYLSDEISNCQSETDYQTLIDDLEYFGRVLNVDVDYHVASVREQLEEFTIYEEQRADHMMDEYKERSRFERATDNSIREMFGSLRSDT